MTRPDTRPARSKAPPPRGRPARRFPIVPVVVGGGLLLALVAVIASAGGGDDDEAGQAAGVEETRPVSVSGEPLAPYGEGADRAVGQPAPTVDGASFDGTQVSIGDDGRPKVLVFLAHWCPHCQAEVPVLAEWLADNGRPTGVDLYAVSTGTVPERPNYPPSAWLDREDFTVPTVADDEEGTTAQAFGLTAFPYFVAVGADHRVVARASGELSVPQWEALLDGARAGGSEERPDA